MKQTLTATTALSALLAINCFANNTVIKKHRNDVNDPSFFTRKLRTIKAPITFNTPGKYLEYKRKQVMEGEDSARAYVKGYEKGLVDETTFDFIGTNSNGQGKNVRIGDDVWIGDIDLANTMSLRGISDASQGYIRFGNSATFNDGRFGWNGSTFFIGNTTYVNGGLTASTLNANDDGNGTNIHIGNDVWLGDINESNTMSLRGSDPSQGYIRFGTSGAKMGWNGSTFSISDGNVGIGTTDISSKLQINESSGSRPEGTNAITKSVLKLSRYGTPGYSYNEGADFRIGHGGDNVWGSKLDLYINGPANETGIPDQHAMTWLHNGNVGIGTDNPQSKLHINYYGNSSAIESDNYNLQIGGTGEGIANPYAGIKFITPAKGTGQGDRATGYIRLEPSNPWFGYRSNMRFLIGTDNAAPGHFTFERFNIAGSGDATLMDINALTGNVGIGTTSPQSKWVVNANAPNNGIAKLVSSTDNAGDQWWLGFDHGGVSTDANDRARIGVNILAGGAGRLFFTTGESEQQVERMRIDEVGRVGIGTTEPNYKLTVAGNSTGNDGLRLSNTGGGNAQVAFYNAAGLQKFAITNISDNTLSFWSAAGGNAFNIKSDGNVGIGTTNTNDANYKLFVETGIKTRKIKVDQQTWSDYVFAPTYKLPTLAEVEAYITKYKHLPDVPSAEEVQKEGLDVGGNQAILLKKIEELTLYSIQQNKELKATQEKNEELTKRLERLEKLITQSSKN